MILLLPLLLCLARSAAPTTFCPVSNADYYDQPNDRTVRAYYECPGPGDPPSHAACCSSSSAPRPGEAGEDSTGSCCPRMDSVLRVDVKLAMLASLAVICACAVIGVTLVVCCFSSSCPAYDTCQGGSYKRREALLPSWDYDGHDTADTDPLTANGNGINGVRSGTKCYEANGNDVKIKVTSPCAV